MAQAELRRPYLAFRTQYLALTSGAYRYYEWIPGSEPTWIEGVVVSSAPGSGSMEADASTDLRSETTVKYDELIPSASESDDYLFAVDTPFQHLRVKPTVAAGIFSVYSNGRLREINSDGDPV